MNDPICGTNQYLKCFNKVEFEVFLGLEQDYTCPYLCADHKEEDEKHGGSWWTNQHDGHGDITYRRIV